jgi:lipopolysaccharide transport system ATP-binding protein
MNNAMIKVENISKLYKLGRQGSGRLREDFTYWFENAFRNGKQSNANQDDKRIWALKNVSFEVAQGEVLGIIGNNGAGKSTLLKIISRITSPTSGAVMGNGRVASLLEVGTGFHAELTGRENIYLNGSILGMGKKEITEKFDEIVDFSGVEKFIDTPVKRYSSGMYTRLAFAVAAHLNPDILIVDEVLAVGDAAFQSKCLGKMKEVSTQKGKTVLFVSHNMQALKNLCTRSIALQHGELIDMGNPESVINAYLKREKQDAISHEYFSKEQAPGNDTIRIRSVACKPQLLQHQTVPDIRTAISLHFEFWYLDSSPGNVIVGVHLFSITGEFIFDICSDSLYCSNGLFSGSCTIPGNFLNDGSYYISLVFVKDTTQRLFYFESCLAFDIEDYRENTAWFGKWQGAVRPNFPVTLVQKESSE